MKRDIDLVRKILQWMEEQAHGRNNNHKIEIEGHTAEEIGYHAYLMHQAGLIIAADATYLNSLSPSWIPISITWEGHDFLEATNKPGLWDKAMKTVIQPAGGVAFSVLKDWIIHEAKGRLGLP